MAGIGTAEPTEKACNKAGVEPKDATTPGDGLGGKKGGAETKQERMLPQSEVDALLGRAGQKIQAKLDAVSAERDLLKAQSESLTSEITEAREKITSLTKDIEAMSEDDPDKDALVKRRREVEAELKALKKERAEIEPAKAEITQWKRDQLIYAVASEHKTADGKDIDMDAFKEAAEELKEQTREAYERLAKRMGLKLIEDVTESEEPEALPPKLYDGKTEGGKQSLGNLNPVERAKEADRMLRAGKNNGG